MTDKPNRQQMMGFGKDDDAWRDTPLSQLDGLTMFIRNKLADVGIDDVGTLATYLDTATLSDVRRIGPSTVEHLRRLVQRHRGQR